MSNMRSVSCTSVVPFGAPPSPVCATLVGDLVVAPGINFTASPMSSKLSAMRATTHTVTVIATSTAKRTPPGRASLCWHRPYANFFF